MGYGLTVFVCVDVNGVAVRSAASTSSSRLGLLYLNNNDTIYIEKVSSDGLWAYGPTSIGYTGWVHGSYLGF